MNTPDVLASDAEREHVAERLRKAAGEGRLSTEELSERLGRVFAARTHSELDAAVAGLPVPAARRSSSLRKRLEREAIYVMPAIVVCILVWLFTGAHGDFWPKWVIFAAVVRMVYGARGSVLRPPRQPRPPRL